MQDKTDPKLKSTLMTPNVSQHSQIHEFESQNLAQKFKKISTPNCPSINTQMSDLIQHYRDEGCLMSRIESDHHDDQNDEDHQHDQDEEQPEIRVKISF